MEIYLWALVFISLYALISYGLPKKTNSKKIFIIFSSIHLIIIQGFRHVSVGTDLIRYQSQYTLSTNIPLDVYLEGRFEIGYQILNFIFASIGISFQGFIFLISVFVFTVLGIFIYKYSESPWLSYVLYMLLGLFDFGFSGLRQIIAMSIILLSFSSIIDENWKKFFLIVFIATLFHRTAIIFIVIYPLTNWNRFNKVYKFSYIPLLLFLVLFGNAISRRAAILFNDDYLLDFTESNEITTTAIIIFIVLIVAVFSKYYINDLKSSQYYNVLLIITSISSLLQLLSRYSYYFTRTNYYMFHFIIIIVPFLYKKWRNLLTGKNKYGTFLINISFYVPFLIISLLYYQIHLSSNPHKIVPYLFFWQ